MPISLGKNGLVTFSCFENMSYIFNPIHLEIIKRESAFRRHFVVNVQYIYFGRADLKIVNQCGNVNIVVALLSS